jgi:hypothetical protein
MRPPIAPQRVGRQVPIIATLTGNDTCTAAGITVTGSAPILMLARRLHGAGHDPAAELHVYRGATLALVARGIGKAARLTVRESTGDGRPRFRLLDGHGPRRSAQIGGAGLDCPGGGARVLATDTWVDWPTAAVGGRS